MAEEGERAPPEQGGLSAKAAKSKAQQMSGLALTTLAKIMDGGGQDSVKLAAAREVLDRAFGPPKVRTVRPRTVKAPAAGPRIVIVKRFTDAPDPDAGDGGQVDS